MVLDSNRGVGVLVTPMALAQSLHSIRSRWTSERRNLWVGWCISSWWSWFWPVYSNYYVFSNVYFSCIVHASLCHYMNIGTVWHCALVSCTSSKSIELLLAVHCSGVSLGAPVTVFLIEFYFIIIFSLIVVTIIGYFLWPCFSFWTTR